MGKSIILWLPVLWYPLCFIHEFGHYISAKINGSPDAKIVWHYGFLSETERSGSSNPIIDIISAPLMVIGVLGLIWLISIVIKFKERLFGFFFGYGLLMNGVYFCLGSIDGEYTDSGQLIGLGINKITIMVISSLIAVVGLYLIGRFSNQSLKGSA